jgi:hypothetical protein
LNRRAHFQFILTTMLVFFATPATARVVSP